jgi:hypothetical protein
MKAMPTGKKRQKENFAAGAQRKLTEIDLREPDRFKERNSRERPEFLKSWVIAAGAPVGRQEYDRIIAELDELRRKWR